VSKNNSGLQLAFAHGVAGRSIFLAVWCWRPTSRRDRARYSILLATAFLANEALLGAALVLLKHMGHDQSAGRIFLLCLHLGNTLLLLATLSVTAAWLSNSSRGFTFIRKWRELTAIGVGLLVTMITGISGAVTALADTLFPATSLRSSLLQDFSSGHPHSCDARRPSQGFVFDLIS
jgi:cytochrome c oxidase assembly protein subunit 15